MPVHIVFQKYVRYAIPRSRSLRVRREKRWSTVGANPTSLDCLSHKLKKARTRHRATVVSA
jgi:hypothetical protein